MAPVAEDRLADDVMVAVGEEVPAELVPVAVAVDVPVAVPVAAVLEAVPAPAVLLNSSQIEVAAAWACSRSPALVQLASRQDTA